MKTTTTYSSGELRVLVAVLDKGEEAVKSITQLAVGHGISAASLTAIGAFRGVTTGCFDRHTTEYLETTIDDQVEVLSLLGDIAIGDDGPVLHAHVVLGCRDASTRGGHLLRGFVWPTLEVVITEAPAHLRRRLDPATGLALIDPQ
jgi:predicted DNA-binding protein with PD1-like motif